MLDGPGKYDVRVHVHHSSRLSLNVDIHIRIILTHTCVLYFILQ